MALKVTRRYKELLKLAQDKQLPVARTYLHADVCCGITTLNSPGPCGTELQQAAFVLGFHDKMNDAHDVHQLRNVLYYAPPTVPAYSGIIAFLKSLGFKKIGGHTINPRYGTRELGIYLLKQE